MRTTPIKMAVAAAGAGVAFALSGCSETVPGTAEPATGNYLDARLQLEQSIRYGASILSCMLLDEKAGTYRNEWGNLTNLNNSDGPDSAPNTDDDGPQHVRMSASGSGGGVDSIPYISLSAMNIQDIPSAELLITGQMNPATERAWSHNGMTPEVLQTGLKSLTSYQVHVDDNAEYPTIIELGEEGQTPTINIPSDESYRVVPATLELADRYSGSIQKVTHRLLKDSGVQDCDIG